MPSDAFVEAAYGGETDEVVLVLARLQHADLASDILVVNNPEDITSNSDVYLACPFEVTLPVDAEGQDPRAQVRIENVSQDVIASLRDIDDAVAIRFQVVLASDPDTVEVEYDGLSLVEVSADAATITGVVGGADPRVEAFPALGFSPGYFAGLF